MAVAGCLGDSGNIHGRLDAQSDEPKVAHGRCIEDGIDNVQNSAEAWHDGGGVFHLAIAFDQ